MKREGVNHAADTCIWNSRRHSRNCSGGSIGGAARRSRRARRPAVCRGSLARPWGPSWVVRTTGADGLQARWKGRWGSFEPFVAPRVLDAAGAGDWCSVALLHMLAQRGAPGFGAARKAEVERALRLGQALAALSCGFEGARGLMSAIGSIERVNRMLRNMVGGTGVFDDVEVTTVRAAKVEICKLCSDLSRTAAATRKNKSA